MAGFIQREESRMCTVALPVAFADRVLDLMRRDGDMPWFGRSCTVSSVQQEGKTLDDPGVADLVLGLEA